MLYTYIGGRLLKHKVTKPEVRSPSSSFITSFHPSKNGLRHCTYFNCHEHKKNRSLNGLRHCTYFNCHEHKIPIAICNKRHFCYISEITKYIICFQAPPRQVVQANGRFGVRIHLRHHGFDTIISGSSPKRPSVQPTNLIRL